MKLLQAVLVGVGPFEKLVLPFTDENGEARRVTVIHGAGGVGKTSVLSALACTRPGHCVVMPNRPDARDARDAATPPFVACDWALGQDEPARPHPLTIVSPNARGSTNDEVESLRRREQVLFDRVAGEGGFAFLSIPSTRWFSRQPIGFSAPGRTVARYDVRATAAGEDATRFDLARETKQALAYAAISAALFTARPQPDKRCDLLLQAMASAVDGLLSLVGLAYVGLDPVSFEPLFTREGRELTFDALPTRARHLVAIAALSVRTCWAAYPHRDPRECEVVIAIDDVDLHQDTHVQERLVSALEEALPEAQWILTTGSSLVAGSADARAVLALRPQPDGPFVRVFAGDQARTH